MRKSNLLKKVVAIASALVLATVSVPMINGAMDVKAADPTDHKSSFGIVYEEGTWNNNVKVTSWDFTDMSLPDGNKTVATNDMIGKITVDSSVKNVAFNTGTPTYLKMTKPANFGDDGAKIRIKVDEDTTSAKLKITATKKDPKMVLKNGNNCYGFGESDVVEFVAVITDGYIELNSVGQSAGNTSDMRVGKIELTEKSGDYSNQYTPTYVQYKSEVGGNYSIRIVYEINAVYGEDKILTNYTNLGAHLKVGSFEEDYYSADGAKVYSKIMANGQEVFPSEGNNAFVVIEITGVPSNAEIGFSAIQQGGSDINASATIKMAEIL